MLLLTLLSLQAAEPSIYVADKILPGRCSANMSREGELVVCGRREGESPYRIGPQPPSPPALPDAQLKISDAVTAKLGAEQGEIGGIPTNRAMVTLKIRF